MMDNDQVKIVEVGPRDGLQNERQTLPLTIKVAFINALSHCGLKFIEAGAFVSPKWIPQMADSSEVFANITRQPGVHYSALVPNTKGLENALAAHCDEVAVFAAASETFSQKNTNCSIAESLKRIQDIITHAKQIKLPVRGYVSCTLGCPYEGGITPAQVAPVAEALYDMGCYEISLGDTIGVGTPHAAKALIKSVAKSIPRAHLAVHYHDTYGQAIANIYAALEEGIRIVDSSAAGLGGCPYAPGASGNVATEDVVYLLKGLGLESGIDLKKLIAASNVILNALHQPTRSKVASAYKTD